jgi:nicotinamidase-related amidase
VTTTADPSTSALLVVHYQNGIVKSEGDFAFSGTAAQVEKHKSLEKTAGVLEAVRAGG